MVKETLTGVVVMALASLNLFALTPTDLSTLFTRSYNTDWGQSKKIRIYKDLAYSTRADLSTEGSGFTGTSNNGKHRSGTYFDVYVRDDYVTSVDQRTKMPVFVFLHGGAWCQPYDKDVACTWLLRCIAEKGYFVVTMDYQLQEDVLADSNATERPNATFGHMLQDVDTMLAYLKDQLYKVNVSTNNIVIGGESAGGHLAMCYAFDETKPLPMSSVGLQPLTHPLHVSCVLSDVGPTDLSGGSMGQMMFSPYFDLIAGMYPQLKGFKAVFGWLTGSDWMSSSMTYDQAMHDMQAWAPNYYITANTCPAIFAYGCTTNAQGVAQADDSLVPVSNFDDLTNRYTKAGIYYKSKLFVGTDHGSVAGVGATWMADRLYEFKTNFFNVTIPAVDQGPSVSYGTLDASAFSKKVDITFSGYSGTTTLTNFPVLVKLSTAISGFKYSDFQQSNGGDLRFMRSDGKLIPHEVDTWNPNGVSTVWVKVPYLTGTTTKITACYGCANPPTVNPKDVWDSNYVGVWHLGESALPLKESSKRTRDISAAIGTGFGYAASGIVGGSVNFGATGKGRMLDAADSWYLDGLTNCTIEAWTYLTARPTGSDKNVAWLSKRNATNSQCSYYFFDDGANTAIRVSGLGTNYVNSGVSISSVPSNSWTHQVFTFNAGATESYKNGANRKTGTTTVTKLFGSSADLHLGNFQMGDARNFPGKIDEVRISRSVRSADWVKATYETVTKANFATYAIQSGEEPPQPSVVYAKSVNVAFGGVQSGVTLTNFPVLVRLSAKIPGFKYSDFKQSNGGDLRFFGADGKLLSHEIDTWNPSGVSTVWVKVPLLNASTTITAKYSCTSGTLPAVSAKDVWDSNYVGVWHLGESGLPLKESSETSSDFETKYGSTIGFAADGVVGGAVNFPAGGQYNSLAAPDHDALDGFSKFTVEFWTLQNEHKHNAGILSKRKEYNKECAYYFYDAINENGVGMVPLCIGTNAATAARWSFNQTQAMDKWDHIAYTADMASTAKNVHGFLNGSMNGWEPNVTFFGPMPNSSAPLVLGNLGANKKDYAFNGSIDEVRISKCVRSKAWVKATYDTVMKPDFATYSTSSGTLSGFAAWMNSKELAGTFDATEANGIPNAVRYAFNIDPATSAVGTPIIQIELDANGNPCVRSRELASGRDDVTLEVLATTDLTDWSKAVLVPMKKFTADGLWKPAASEGSSYVFPAKMFFKYRIDIQ